MLLYLFHKYHIIIRYYSSITIESITHELSFIKYLIYKNLKTTQILL